MHVDVSYHIIKSVSHLIISIDHYKSYQLFSILLIIFLHFQLTFIVMGLPAAASDNVETGVNTADTPPKYEDVTEKPPKYDEATMTAQQ